MLAAINKTIEVIIISCIVFLLCSYSQDSFKTRQLRYPRVREAYATKEDSMKDMLKGNEIKADRMEIYLRAFKAEKELELWAKNREDNCFKLLKTYNICSSSGQPGPKRKKGDYQVPEGFYHINIFNPHSNFYLSLGINYPNKSDRIHGDKNSPGGDIYIHGSCVSIGCIPITDPEIKELYIFCVEARNNGQEGIPVTIFPARMDSRIYTRLYERYKDNTDYINLWNDLHKGFNIFNTTKKLPEIEFLKDGRHKL